MAKSRHAAACDAPFPTAAIASRMFCSFTVAMANLVCFGENLMFVVAFGNVGVEISYVGHGVHCGVVALLGRPVYSARSQN